jgi:hypothetical protein
MTLARNVVFDVLTYWQVGSGLGEEASADSVVARDEAGLPFLPGRTVKGLLRNATDLAGVPQERIERWFGSANGGLTGPLDAETDVRLEQSRFTTRPGVLWFGSARLPDAWRHWSRGLAATGDDEPGEEMGRMIEARGALFRFVASTSIDAEGVARDKTLRVAEVAVPMRLRSRIEGPADDRQWVEDVAAALPLLRAIGTRRHRGYGRVRCSLEDD